ncbi:hypothetical protein AB0C96_41130 [Streptomyces sp. NPDC048506]|uniref:hypothetical protein n=1 Tax=Streptomyces sp. NPDC048506 TaxID=3155028 RepID=UPI00344886C0
MPTTTTAAMSWAQAETRFCAPLISSGVSSAPWVAANRVVEGGVFVGAEFGVGGGGDDGEVGVPVDLRGQAACRQAGAGIR